MKRSKAKPLLLDGKPFDPNPSSPTDIKIMKFLDNRPGEVFSSSALHGDIPVGIHSLHFFARDPKYAPYIYRSGHTLVFGTPSAIEQYRALVESPRTRES